MKNCIFFLIILISVNELSAQNIEGEFITGLNLSQIDGDQLAGYNKLGIVVGGAAGFNLKKDFGLKFRILFSQKGSRSGENDLFYESTRLTYLEFPLLFEYTLDDKYLLEAGFQGYYLLRARIDDGFGFGDVRKQFEPRVYGFNLGIGYKFENWIFRLSYQRSLSNLTKIAGYLERSLSVTVAYRLRQN
jgi:hypothetical protein